MLKKIAAAAALAIVASTAAAQDTTAPAFYVGADVGSTKADDFDDRETGYGIFAGYQLNETFAIEANYRRLMDAEELGYTATVDQIGLSAIATMPLANNFGLYGRLGYNRLNAKVSGNGVSDKENESKALYGVGLSYAITPTATVRVEWQKPHSDFSNISAGVAFKF